MNWKHYRRLTIYGLSCLVTGFVSGVYMTKDYRNTQYDDEYKRLKKSGETLTGAIYAYDEVIHDYLLHQDLDTLTKDIRTISERMRFETIANLA